MAMLKRVCTFVCNTIWLLACLPSWAHFQFALRQPRRAQKRILHDLLRKNRHTDFGQLHEFSRIRTPEAFAARIPLADYDAFAHAISQARQGMPFSLASDAPRLLEPTSGTSGKPKLIPLTAGLLREFSAATLPWIAWLYLAHPRLLFGCQYWAISPNTPFQEGNSAPPDSIPIGFSGDADYLGPAGRLLSRGMQAVPPELRLVHDRESFLHLTLFFLLKEPNLRLISVWHPSYLTLLLDAIPRQISALLKRLRTGGLEDLPELPADLRQRLAPRFTAAPARAKELETMDLGKHPEHIRHVWPSLTVVSCWVGERSNPWLSRICTLFPGVTIQGKGLLATEGIVTLPTGCGQRYPCAVRSHYLEFIEADSGSVHPVWKLRAGQEYSVVLSTGGGLWRYRLHDRVRVTGFCHATPCLEFIGKDNMISDLVGEKLDENHVAEALARSTAGMQLPTIFTMLVPAPPGGGNPPGYRLLMDLPETTSARETARRLARNVEEELRKNYHYAHARNLGQLAPLTPWLAPEAATAFRSQCEQNGARSATVKFPALSTTHSRFPPLSRPKRIDIVPP